MLTANELRTLELMAEGLNSEEIGERLGYAAETIRGWRKTMRRSIGARNACHMVALGYERGWLRKRPRKPKAAS